MLHHLNRLARLFWVAVSCASVLIITLSAILLTYITLRGLPEEFQTLLREEFQQRGLLVDWDFVGLDPLARVSVKNFRCRGVLPGRESVVQIEQALFDVGWLSAVRGEQILNGITIKNASFEFLTGGGGKIVVDRFDAQALITSENIFIQDGTAFFGRAALRMNGEIPLRFFKASDGDREQIPELAAAQAKPENQEDPTPWDFYAEKLHDVMDKSGLQAEIHFLSRPGYLWDALGVSLTADSGSAEFEGVRWESVSLQANWERGKLSIGRLFLKTESGALSVSGYYTPSEGIIAAELFVNTPPESLVPLMPQELATRFQKIITHGSFSLETQTTINIRDSSATSAHGHLEWLDISLGNGRVDEILVPFHIDRGRLQIPTAKIEASGEIFEFNVSSGDITRQITSQAAGAINPARIEYLLPEAKDFFGSTIFKKPVYATLATDFFPAEEVKLKIQGRVSVNELNYKDVEIISASSDLEFTPPLLLLSNLKLERPDGVGTAERVQYDYSAPCLLLTGVRTRFSTLPTARIFGPKLEEYLRPYIFPVPPEIQIEGFIDLATEQNTDLKIFAQGPSFVYPLLGRDVPGENFSTRISLRANRLEIDALKARVDGGDLDFRGSFLLQPARTPYQLEVALRNADFSRLMKGFFNLSDITGRVTGGANISGLLEDLRTMRGEGQLSVREGSLIDIPFLGALSEVAGLFELGKARASEADATFRIENGKIYTNDLDIRSVTMALIGNGHYDFVDDQMQLDVRLNMRGPAGLVLFPVSKLFEYRGTGSLAGTKWEPKLFTPAVPIPGSAQGSAPPVRGKNR